MLHLTKRTATILVILSASVLGGCYTLQGLNQNLANLVGLPLDTAIHVLGYPNGERQIAGHHIYVWATNRRGVLLMPQQTSANGMVWNGAGATYYSGAATSLAPVELSFNCEIDLEVDQINTIVSYQYQGNWDGCAPYMHRLADARTAMPTPQAMQFTMPGAPAK